MIEGYLTHVSSLGLIDMDPQEPFDFFLNTTRNNWWQGIPKQRSISSCACSCAILLKCRTNHRSDVSRSHANQPRYIVEAAVPLRSFCCSLSRHAIEALGCCLPCYFEAKTSCLPCSVSASLPPCLSIAPSATRVSIAACRASFQRAL